MWSWNQGEQTAMLFRKKMPRACLQNKPSKNFGKLARIHACLIATLSKVVFFSKFLEYLWRASSTFSGILITLIFSFLSWDDDYTRNHRLLDPVYKYTLTKALSYLFFWKVRKLCNHWRNDHQQVFHLTALQNS